MRTVVFTGGGTAGHVLPAVPVMRALRQRGFEVVFIGSAGGLEKQYLESLQDIRFYGIASGKLRRYWSWRNLTDAFGVLRGTWQSLRLLGRIRPGLIFSKGGHLSFPVVLAGWMRRIPIVAHESDFTPGLANRLAHALPRCALHEFSDAAAPVAARRTRTYRIAAAAGTSERIGGPGTGVARGTGGPAGGAGNRRQPGCRRPQRGGRGSGARTGPALLPCPRMRAGQGRRPGLAGIPLLRICRSGLGGPARRRRPGRFPGGGRIRSSNCCRSASRTC